MKLFETVSLLSTYFSKTTLWGWFFRWWVQGAEPMVPTIVGGAGAERTQWVMKRGESPMSKGFRQAKAKAETLLRIADIGSSPTNPTREKPPFMGGFLHCQKWRTVALLPCWLARFLALSEKNVNDHFWRGAFTQFTITSWPACIILRHWKI